MLTKTFIVILMFSFLSLLVSIRLCNKFSMLFMQKGEPTNKATIEHAEMTLREN